MTDTISSKLNNEEVVETPQLNLQSGVLVDSSRFLQIKGRYIVVGVKSGLMVIDQHRAHERIQYDKLLGMAQSSQVVSQQLLFPEIVDLTIEDACIIEEISMELKAVEIFFM